MADCGNCVYYERGYCNERNTHVTSYGSCSRYVGIGANDRDNISDCYECCFYDDGYCGYWRKKVSSTGKCSQGHA